MNKILKRVMCLIALIPLIVTCVVFQLLPERIPAHYNAAGEIDRYGSKWESFLLPIVGIAASLLLLLFMHIFEKKTVTGETDKAKQDAKINAKALGFVGIAVNVLFCGLTCFTLYSAYSATSGEGLGTMDIAKGTCILMGVLFVVLGNLSAKTRKNSTLGFRIRYTMYNDVTWRKGNFAAGVGFVIAGILTIITTLFVDGLICTYVMLGYLLVVILVATVYAKKVYEAEKKVYEAEKKVRK